MTLTRQLCELITATRFETLGAECVRRVKQAIKDGIAVAAAGCGQQPVKLLAAHLKGLGGKPQATLWGHGFKSSPVHAAYVNGVATHVLDFEPMWDPPTHSVSPTMPVAFALAEAKALNGREIVTAVAKGMELQGRIQFAGNQYRPGSLRYHPPGIVGVMGAAVTAGHLLGCDSDRLAHALGIAASRAGALPANIGSMTKSTHCGYAAASGLDAALLASRGFTANPGIFEAPRGYIATFFPQDFEPEKLLAYGRPFRMVDPGLAIKLFPSQFGTHWAITAALELHAKINDPHGIARVTIRGPEMEYVNRPQPATGLDGKSSFQYATAAALLDGRVGIDSFSDARRVRSDMVALLGKIDLIQDPAIPGDWRGMRVTVEVELRDGRTLSAVCTGPRGAWGRPALTAEKHETKLRDCLARMLDDASMARLFALLDRLEEQPARGVVEIIGLITGTAVKRRGSRRS